MKSNVSLLLAALIMFMVSCSEKQPRIVTLKTFPLNSLDNVLGAEMVTLDSVVSSDGAGSLKITAESPVTVPLIRVENIDIENTQLIYRAKIRTEDFSGRTFLEMWCEFEGRGQYFSRDLQTPVTGNTDWTTEETPFQLNEGENPERIYLNVVIQGTGTVWIDEIELLTST